MLALFIVFFVAALAFSMLFFIFFSDEAKRRNISMLDRTLYLLIIATACWILTLPALTSTYSTTTAYTAYNVIQTSSNTAVTANIVIAYPAHNVTQTDNKGLSAGAISSYTIFWTFMLLVNFALLIVIILTRSKEIAKRVIEES